MRESEAAVLSSALGFCATEVILVCSWAGVYLLQLNYVPALSVVLLLVQSVILIHWLVWKKIQPWHKGWGVFSCRYVLITAKCFHWLQQCEHSWKQHGWWFLGMLVLPLTEPSPCCLRTLFWNKSGNVRQTCANVCCDCCLEGLPAGSPRWFCSCTYRASLVGRLWFAVGVYWNQSAEAEQVLAQLRCLRWVGECGCRLCCTSCMHVMSCYP